LKNKKHKKVDDLNEDRLSRCRLPLAIISGEQCFGRGHPSRERSIVPANGEGGVVLQTWK